MENQEYTKRNNELFAELAKYPEDSQEYRDIVTKIAKNNEPLVKFAVTKAKRYYFLTLKSTTLNSDDLMSDGYYGLLRAIKAFKKEKGTAFTTYAMSYIMSVITKHLNLEKSHLTISLEGNQDRNKQSLKDYIASPVNIEEDFVKKDETERQMAWVRENLDQLTPVQKRVLTARYLSGDTMVKIETLAKEIGCVPSGIADAKNRAINKLRKIYYESHPEEIKSEEAADKAAIELTNEEKIQLKKELKNLIATKLTPMRKRIMLRKFYSSTPKTIEQVAEEIGSTKQNVTVHINASCRKLRTLCEGIKDTKHLKNILEFRVAENAKEY